VTERPPEVEVRLLRGQQLLVRARVVVHGVKALEKYRFRPMYAEANMGHPSRTMGRGYAMKSGGWLASGNTMNPAFFSVSV
jgi:hypothetical protein